MSNSRRAQGSGSVYLRKDGRWAAAAVVDGKRITRYGKTKKEAWDNLQTHLRDLEQGKVTTGPKQTVAEYLTHWLEDLHKLEIRTRSYGTQKYKMQKYIIPAIGHIELSKLTREHVQAFVSGMVGDGYAPNTVRSVHSILHAALADAVLHETLNRNVSENVTLPRIGEAETQVLTSEECERLIAAARDHRLWFFIVLAIATGARRGELLALRWSDVDLEAGTIFIHRSVGRTYFIKGYIENEQKTRAGRRKPHLPQFVLDLIDEQKKRIDEMRVKAGSKWEEHDLVFPNRHGRYYHQSAINEEFSSLLEKAGLPHVRIHDLRHSAATLLLASGVNVKVVQELLGHSNISTTLGKYGHVMPSMQKEVTRTMDSIFGEQS
jgi:integrase